MKIDTTLNGFSTKLVKKAKELGFNHVSEPTGWPIRFKHDRILHTFDFLNTDPDNIAVEIFNQGRKVGSEEMAFHFRQLLGIRE